MKSLQQYRLVVPEFDRLMSAVRTLLTHDAADLEFVYQTIRHHLERNNLTESDAAHVAEQMMGDLCLDFPSTEITFLALRSYVHGHDCFHAYDRLLTEFKPKLTKEEYRSLAERGIRLFQNELITWDPPNID